MTLPVDKFFELESKFEVGSQQDLDQLDAMFRACSAAFHRSRNYETIIHYYDTQDHALENAGVFLRTMDECLPYFKSELDVKTRGQTVNGVLEREEYEFFPKGNGLDLSVIDNARVKNLLKPAEGKALSKVFNTVTRRQDICLVFDDNGKKIAIDLALDEISYEAKDKAVLRHAFEVEIEFKQRYSDPDVEKNEAVALINRLKTLFSTAVTLIPVHESRAETGFRLAREREAAAPAAPQRKRPSGPGR